MKTDRFGTGGLSPRERPLPFDAARPDWCCLRFGMVIRSWTHRIRFRAGALLTGRISRLNTSKRHGTTARSVREALLRMRHLESGNLKRRERFQRESVSRRPTPCLGGRCPISMTLLAGLVYKNHIESEATPPDYI